MAVVTKKGVDVLDYVETTQRNSGAKRVNLCRCLNSNVDDREDEEDRMFALKGDFRRDEAQQRAKGFIGCLQINLTRQNNVGISKVEP